jgi:hypothetical protein
MSRCSAANLPNKPPRWVEGCPSRLDMAKAWISGGKAAILSRSCPLWVISGIETRPVAKLPELLRR